MKPVLTPILALLQSRKVMVALTFLLAFVLTLAVPGLKEYRDNIQTALLLFGSVLIGAIAYEDGAAKSAPITAQEAVEAVESGPKTPAEAGKQIIFEAADDIFGGETPQD
jgi:hypothetical protein